MPFSVQNVLILEKCGIKIHYWVFCWPFLLFFGYTVRMPLFSRIRPASVSIVNFEQVNVSWENLILNQKTIVYELHVHVERAQSFIANKCCAYN